MLNPNILDKDPSWMRTASVDELREFIRFLDDQPNTPRVKELLIAFDKECDRRAAMDNETRNNGEWI